MIGRIVSVAGAECLIEDLGVAMAISRPFSTATRLWEEFCASYPDCKPKIDGYLTSSWLLEYRVSSTGQAESGPTFSHILSVLVPFARETRGRLARRNRPPESEPETPFWDELRHPDLRYEIERERRRVRTDLTRTYGAYDPRLCDDKFITTQAENRVQSRFHESLTIISDLTDERKSLTALANRLRTAADVESCLCWLDEMHSAPLASPLRYWLVAAVDALGKRQRREQSGHDARWEQLRPFSSLESPDGGPAFDPGSAVSPRTDTGAENDPAAAAEAKDMDEYVGSPKVTELKETASLLLNQRLTHEQLAVLRLKRENSNAKHHEIAERLGVSRAAVTKWLKIAETVENDIMRDLDLL